MTRLSLQPQLYDASQPAVEVQKSLLRQMIYIRLVEEKIIELYPQQEMRCPTHICTGQEAIPAGISEHLTKTDMVFSAHRSHGHYLAKGGDLDAMLAELYGKATGCASGKGGSQHLIDLDAGFMGSAPILASTISVGVGAAWTCMGEDDDRVTVIYFGDGATEEGAFHEAMNFAGTNQLPVVFVCENNLYSVHTALDVRQPGRKIFELGPAHGMEGLEGDGNKVEEVWQLGAYAINKARKGGGPTILELQTYRWAEHCGTGGDLHLNYRSEQEFNEWQSRCPVKKYSERLQNSNVVTDDELAGIHSEINIRIDQAVKFARESPFPEADQLNTFVYPE